MRTVSKTSSHRTQQALPLLGTGVRTPGKRVVSEYGVGSLKGLRRPWFVLGAFGGVRKCGFALGQVSPQTGGDCEGDLRDFDLKGRDRKQS